MTTARLLFTCLVAAAYSTSAPAEDSSGSPAQVAASEAGKSYTVRREPFSVEVELQGVLESTEMHEVRLVPDTWPSWRVDRAVEHGTSVRKGDPVIWFNRRGLEQKLQDLSAGKALTKLELEQAQEELALLEKSVPMELAKIRRATRVADEDLSRFAKIDKPASLRNSAFSLESAQNFLAYEKEELKQLERMYKADDLTDETEEIILRRARDSVKRSEHSLARAKEKHAQTSAVEIPRTEAERTEAAEAARLALRAAEADLPLKLSKAKLSVDKLKYDHHKAGVEEKRLARDWKSLTLTAPADGIVYYGACENGRWSSAAAVAKTLRPGGTPTPHAVLMTIVDPEKMVMRADVPQDELGSIRRDTKASVTVVGLDQPTFEATLLSRPAPTAANDKFTCVFVPAKRAAEELARIRHAAGMKCTAKIATYAAPFAIVVPKAAVYKDDLWHEAHFVYLAGENGSSRKYWVDVPHAVGERVEIVPKTAGRIALAWRDSKLAGSKPPWQGQKSGVLSDGAKILLEKPSAAN